MRLTLIAVVVFLACTSVEAQSSVTLTGTVSETVVLSVAPGFSHGEVVSSGNTVRMILSGHDDQSAVIRVPLLVRSNSSFKISAMFESQTAGLEQLSVSDVQATGSLVAPQLVNSLEIKQEGDNDTSRPLLVLSGPRVSRGGTLASPNNALKVTLLIRLKPQTTTGWTVHLTLVGTAGSLTQ
jgi:hypothetical protein